MPYDPDARMPIGKLDAFAFAIEQIAPVCAQLYNGGRYRMTPEECRAMAQALARIRVSTSQMRDVLKLFEAIAQRPELPQIVERVAAMEGFVPRALAMHSAPEERAGAVLP